MFSRTLSDAIPFMCWNIYKMPLIKSKELMCWNIYIIYIYLYNIWYRLHYKTIGFSTLLKNKVKNTSIKYLSNYIASCFQVSIELNFGFFNIVVGVNNSDSLGVGDR